MSERNDLPATASMPAHAAAPPVSASETMTSQLSQVSAASSAVEEEARARVTVLEREAKALGTDPAAAILFHEIGLLWEDPLRNPRNAAVAFQNAYKLAPRFVSNIRAARRLFSEVGNWQMSVQLIDAEIAASPDQRAQAALLLEKARVLEERLSREEEAQAALRQCLELSPKELPLLVQLEQAYSEKGDFPSLVEVQKLLAQNITDPQLRAQYLLSAGQLLEDRLNRPEAASACYREAFALDRKNLQLLSAMKSVAEREGAVEDLLAALGAEAELLAPGSSPVYLRIAKVHAKLGRSDEALAALLAARKQSPHEPLVLSELAQIYEAQGRYQELADVLLSWVASINDESEVVAVNLRLAMLYEEQLKRDPEAIDRYQAILSRVPGHATALAGLGKLYFRTQDWAGLLASFDAEVAALSEPRQKAGKLYKAAEVLEERLGRQEEAIARYNQCLQLQPGFLPAQKALARLYERQSRFGELLAMHEQDLLHTSDREQIIFTLNKMAAIHEERLNDPERAVECLKRILELASDHLPTIRNLARLHERAGKWKELIEIQETEAGLAGDTKQVLSLHHRNAEILEEQLKDRAGAIAAYERLLSLSPAYLPALRALGRLYAQDGRWEDLLRMYRAEAEISASTDQAAALLHKVGELFEQRLKDENQAIASYQEVLTLCPTYFPAVRALARIYRNQGAWESLIEVLRAEAANRADPLERANALFQAATIWEDQLGRPEMAIGGYQEVLRLTPGHPAGLGALERLMSSRNEVKELIVILDRQTQLGEGWARVAAYLKLARLYLDRLNEPSRAAQCCEAALGFEPRNLPALMMLERARAADRARRLELRSRLAEAVTEDKLQLALRLAVSQDQEQAGLSPSQATGEHSRLLEVLRAALAADPADATSAFALECELRRTKDWAGLAELYQQRLAKNEGAERLELTLRLAHLHEQKTGNLESAAAAYQAALQADPALLPALQGARRTWLALGDFAKARDALETEGKVARDPRTAIEAFLAAAQLSRERLGEAERAAEDYRKALERDPLDPTAGGGLEEILAAKGGGADLAQLHEKRGEAKLAQKDHLAAASELHLAARQYLEHLGDRERALGAVERALAAYPAHPEALELKGEISFSAQQYTEAAAALAVRVQLGGDPGHLALIHLKLGALYHDQLNDLTRAAAHLQTALAGSPGNLEALERLAAIHTISRNWVGAADCLKQILELETRPEPLARHQVALGRILDEGFDDVPGAINLLRKALERMPGDAGIVDRLAELYQRTEKLAELAEMLEQQAALSQDSGRRLALKLKLGDLQRRVLKDIPRAISSYRGVLEIDPQHLPARAVLADLYMQDAAAAPMAIEEHRALLRLEPTRIESLHALFRLWEGLKQPDKAFCAAGLLHYLKAANEAERAFYAEAKNRLPQETQARLSPQEVEQLMHPGARDVLVDLLRAIGDQLTKLYPPRFDLLGVDRKADRLKPDHAVFKAVRAVAQVFGVEELEVYQARRGSVLLETTEPLGVCVGEEVVRKYNAREQKFLIGRAALGLYNRSAVVAKLSASELAALLGNSVRIFHPDFARLGQRDEEATRQLRKAYSRKALRALEGPAGSALGAERLEVERTVAALNHSGNRAGLLLCADVAAGLNVLLREDPELSGVREESAELAAEALGRRPELRELFHFALSEEFFRLREKVALAV